MPVSIFRTRKNVNEANAVFAIKSFYLEEMEVDEGDGDRNIFDIISHAMSVDS